MTRNGSSVEANVASFRTIVEDVWSGDLTAFDEVFAPDVVVHTPFETFESRDAYRSYVEESVEIVPDFRAELEAVCGEGDTVAGRFTQRGTQTGAAPRLRLPATGESFEFPGANFARFDDGQCVEMWTIWDKVEFLQQLDLFPDSPRAIVRLVVGQLRARLAGR